MTISPALRGIIRPPHHLGGVARSRSLFVATPPLILPRVKHGAGLLRSTTVGNAYMRSLQGISGVPADGISQGSTYIGCLLSNLGKMPRSGRRWKLTCEAYLSDPVKLK